MVVNCGLFWVSGEEIKEVDCTWRYIPERIVPLDKVHIESCIVETTAEVKVVQDYINRYTYPIEAIYLFPLDENAAVCEFEAEINGKRIMGMAKSKNEATKDYNNAISRGDGAYLLEQEKPDIFRAKVGNIPPGCKVSITIKYVAEVKNELDKIRFVLPTHVAPRYSPYNSTNIDTSHAYVGYKLSLNVTCISPSGFNSIESPSHLISSTIDGQVATISLDSGITELSKDFVLLFSYPNPHEPKVIIESDGKGSHAAMISFCPHLEFADVKTELIFLIDRSGSMDEKVNEVRQAMQLFMRSLPADCYFNIIGFGSTYNKLFTSSVRYDEQSLNQATHHSSSISADLGGTEIYEPLEHIFEQSVIPGYSRQVFVLTDGQVSNTEQVINLVAKNNKNSRVFALGIGNDVSHHLVEGIARAGKGTAFFVLSGERIEKKVMKQLSDATQPALNNVKIDWGVGGFPNKTESIGSKMISSLLSFVSPSINQKSSSFQQAPFRVPPLYSDDIFRIYAIFQTDKIPDKVVIEANSPDGILKAEIEVDKGRIIKGNLLHTLAARTLIRDLEEGSSSLHPTQGGSQSPELIKNEIIRLGTTYCLASKYTSFVAIEERSAEEKHFNCYGEHVTPTATPAIMTTTTTMMMSTITTESITPFDDYEDCNMTEQSELYQLEREQDCDLVEKEENDIEVNIKKRKTMDFERYDDMNEGSDDMNERSRVYGDVLMAKEEEILLEDKEKAYGDNDDDEAEEAKPKGRYEEKEKEKEEKPKMSILSSSSSKKVVLDPRETMVRLLNNQSFQGYFNNTSDLFSILGLSNECNSISCLSSISSQKEIVWATSLAISYLQFKLGELEDEWKLAANKAKNGWLL